MSNVEHRKLPNSPRVWVAVPIAACIISIILQFILTSSVNAPEVGAAGLPAQQSSAARKPAPGSVPTSTPTLTPPARMSYSDRAPQTPDSPLSVPGQPQVDANTLALYHFDAPNGNLSIDATSNYTGTLNGNAIITPTGLYAGVLQLDGTGSYVRLGNVGSLGEGTIEAFVDFSQVCHCVTSIISAGGDYGSHQTTLWLGESPISDVTFGLFDGSTWHFAYSGVNAWRYLATGGTTNPFPWQNIPVKWPYETWRFHHVAATWGPRGMEIWIDGVLHGVGTTATDNLYPFVYKCNPQDQEASVRYPVCQTPVAAPTMNPLPPPGDYYGGLAPYSNFLIGCDQGATVFQGSPSAACFNGRIDEVRISNIQRTFSPSVVPTLTPTPTQTPQTITGQYGVDAFTRGLYHFNNSGSTTIIDETGQFNGGLAGNAQIAAAGRFGGSLAVDGSNSYAVVGNIGEPVAGTLESWIKYVTVKSQFVVIHGGDTWGGPTSHIYLGALGGMLQFGLDDGAGNGLRWLNSLVSTTSLADNCWHHLAGTWGARGMEIWIDGTIRTSDLSYTGNAHGLSSAYLFGCGSGGSCFVGNIDEVRLSTIQRVFVPYLLAPVKNQLSPEQFKPSGNSQVFFPFITSNSGCAFGP